MFRVELNITPSKPGYPLFLGAGSHTAKAAKHHCKRIYHTLQKGEYLTIIEFGDDNELLSSRPFKRM